MRLANQIAEASWGSIAVIRRFENKNLVAELQIAILAKACSRRTYWNCENHGRLMMKLGVTNSENPRALRLVGILRPEGIVIRVDR